MNAAESRPKAPRQYTKHGIAHLKNAVNTLGSRAIDRRTFVGRALAAWRSELIADLGGIEAVSTQELALLEEAVKAKLMLDSIDAWILQQKTLINKRARAVLPAVRDRQSLVSTLRGLLGDLGLKRRSHNEPSLSEYLVGRAQGGTAKTDGSPGESEYLAERTQGGTAKTAKSPGEGTEHLAERTQEGTAKTDESPVGGEVC